MRIYVASLADYNDGVLFGKWFTIEDYTDKTQLMEAIEDMLKGSPYLKWLGISAEEIEKHGASNWTEYAVHDYEDCPSFLSDTEYPDLDDFFTYRDLVEGVHADEDAVLAYLDIVSLADASVEDFEDRYRGKYDSEEDYAMELLEELGELKAIPEHLRYYFDYEAYARDLFINDMTFIDGHVFWNC
jgi:antirestriction protein